MDITVACKACGLVQRLEELSPGMVAECARCGSRLARHKPDRLGRPKISIAPAG